MIDYCVERPLLFLLSAFRADTVCAASSDGRITFPFPENFFRAIPQRCFPFFEADCSEPWASPPGRRLCFVKENPLSFLLSREIKPPALLLCSSLCGGFSKVFSPLKHSATGVSWPQSWAHSFVMLLHNFDDFFLTTRLKPFQSPNLLSRWPFLD